MQDKFIIYLSPIKDFLIGFILIDMFLWVLNISVARTYRFFVCNEIYFFY